MTLTLNLEKWAKLNKKPLNSSGKVKFKDLQFHSKWYMNCWWKKADKLTKSHVKNLWIIWCQIFVGSGFQRWRQWIMLKLYFLLQCFKEHLRVTTKQCFPSCLLFTTPSILSAPILSSSVLSHPAKVLISSSHSSSFSSIIPVTPAWRG